MPNPFRIEAPGATLAGWDYRQRVAGTWAEEPVALAARTFLVRRLT